MVFEVLGRGKSSAQTGKELCALLGITSRELTQMVEAERRQGHPICASVSAPFYGYYLAQNMEEMQNYCSSLAHRIAEIAQTRAACMRAGETLPK